MSKQNKILLSAFLLTLLTGCGGGGTPRVAPTCLPNGQCAGSYFLAAAEPDGVALFADPYSGSARASIPLQNAESFVFAPTVDTPSTAFVAVPPDKLYTYNYPYATADGTLTLPVSDISQMAFISLPNMSLPLQLLVADTVNNDLAVVDLTANPPALTEAVGGLDRPNAFSYDAQRQLWVAEAAEIAVFSIQSGGVFTRTETIAAGVSAPDGLLLYDQNMYVADAGNNSIEVFTPGSTAPAFAVTAGLNKPRSMIWGYGNDLYVANKGDNSIAAFALPLTSTSTPLWINRNLAGTPRALATWFSPSF